MAIKELGVLAEMELEQDLPIEKQTVYNGDLTIYNVPHLKNEIAEGVYTYIIPGEVMYRMTHIFQYMIDREYKEIDYEISNELF